MNTDHPVVVFTTEPITFSYPCPGGSDDHDHLAGVPAQAVAYCLCGWMFVGDFDLQWNNPVDTAYTLAKMQAREHLHNPLKGMTGE